jgi:hypothetical protein
VVNVRRKRNTNSAWSGAEPSIDIPGMFENKQIIKPGQLNQFTVMGTDADGDQRR